MRRAASRNSRLPSRRISPGSASAGRHRSGYSPRILRITPLPRAAACIGAALSVLCTRTDLAAVAAAPHGAAPVYPGTCRHLGESERVRRIVAGTPFAWRLDHLRALARTGPLVWHDRALRHDRMPAGDNRRRRDRAQGDRRQLSSRRHLGRRTPRGRAGDPRRGSARQHHVHRLLQALLGLPVPEWHHHGLLVDATEDGWPSAPARRRCAAYVTPDCQRWRCVRSPASPETLWRRQPRRPTTRSRYSDGPAR